MRFFIWNNYSIPKGKEIEQAIIAAGARLIYLPPYSPDFNPIENCWSKIKNILCSIGARNYQDLELAIFQAYSQVSLKDIYILLLLLYLTILRNAIVG